MTNTTSPQTGNIGNSGDSPENEHLKVAGPFSLRGLLEVFFRRKIIFIIPIILVPLLSISLSYVVPERYMSTTTIMVDRSRILNPLVRFETAVSLQDWDSLSTLRKIIYSRPVIEKLIEELNLESADTSPQEHEWLINDVRSNIHIISQEAHSFEVGCSADDPATAQQMTEKISAFFIDQALEGTRNEANAAVEFITEQLNTYSQQLERAKDNLKTFRLANLDKIQQQKAVQSDLDRYEKDILQTEIKLRETQFKRELYKRRLSQEDPMVVAEQLYNQDTPYQRRYRELRLQKAKLLSSRSEDHPEVLKLDREMQTIVDLLNEEKQKGEAEQERVIQSPTYQKTEAKLQETEVTFETLKYQLKGYRDEMKRLREKRAEIPELQNKHDRLQSVVENLKNTRNSLRTKLQQAKISRAVETEQQKSRFRVINPPLIPLSRYSPIRKKYAVAGAATGIILGFVLIIGLELVEPRLCRLDEVERATSLPIWATIPAFHGAKKHLHERIPGLRGITHMVRQLIGPHKISLPHNLCDHYFIGAVHANQFSMDASDPELENNVRTALKQIQTAGAVLQETADDLEQGTIAAVTSARQGEGKTITVANVAGVLAMEVEKNVLMVDMDENTSDLTRQFDREDAQGLSDILADGTPASQCIHPTDIPGLDILPVGTKPQKSYKLEINKKIPDLLASLKKKYAFILLDMPPVTTSPNTRRICASADVNLLITRLYVTPGGVATAAAHNLPEKPRKGSIVNGREYWLPDWILNWI